MPWSRSKSQTYAFPYIFLIHILCLFPPSSSIGPYNRGVCLTVGENSSSSECSC